MTALQTGKPVTRLTTGIYKGRALVITLYPAYVTIRRLGMRTETYNIGYDTIFETAAKIDFLDYAQGQAITQRGKKKRKRA